MLYGPPTGQTEPYSAESTIRRTPAATAPIEMSTESSIVPAAVANDPCSWNAGSVETVGWKKTVSWFTEPIRPEFLLPLPSGTSVKKNPVDGEGTLPDPS